MRKRGCRSTCNVLLLPSLQNLTALRRTVVHCDVPTLLHPSPDGIVDTCDKRESYRCFSGCAPCGAALSPHKFTVTARKRGCRSTCTTTGSTIRSPPRLTSAALGVGDGEGLTAATGLRLRDHGRVAQAGRETCRGENKFTPPAVDAGLAPGGGAVLPIERMREPLFLTTATGVPSGRINTHGGAWAQAPTEGGGAEAFTMAADTG